jgi:hypothetical protein
MNRFDTQLQSTAFVHPAKHSDPQLAGTPRLLVVMFDAHEEAALAGRILALAGTRGLPVILVGIAPDPKGKQELRRKLVTIAAFLRGENSNRSAHPQEYYAAFGVEILMEEGRDWLDKLRGQLQSNDLLACYAEQYVGTRRRPLSDVLSSNLNVPIYTFSGLLPARDEESLLIRTASWLGSLGSIGGFLMLQWRIVAASQGPTQSVLLLLTLIAEVGVIWLLNSFLGQL